MHISPPHPTSIDINQHLPLSVSTCIPYAHTQPQPITRITLRITSSVWNLAQTTHLHHICESSTLSVLRHIWHPSSSFLIPHHPPVSSYHNTCYNDPAEWVIQVIIECYQSTYESSGLEFPLHYLIHHELRTHSSEILKVAFASDSGHLPCQHNANSESINSHIGICISQGMCTVSDTIVSKI